jgi:hypothetical protein
MFHTIAVRLTKYTHCFFVTKKSCGTAIADLQNLTSAIPQAAPATFLSLFFSYFLVPFPQLKMFLKINH